jgi:predicted RNA binding protein YcfA (HicA-like mRNA interferase family)
LAALSRIGWAVKRQSGSHRVLTQPIVSLGVV